MHIALLIILILLTRRCIMIDVLQFYFFFACLFFFYSPLHAALSLAEYKGTYDPLPDNKKHLSPLHGAIWWHTQLIEKYYRFGGQNLDETINENDPATIKLIHFLFEAQGGNFTPRVNDATQMLTPELIGTIIKTIEITEKTEDPLKIALTTILTDEKLTPLIPLLVKSCHECGLISSSDYSFMPHTVYMILLAYLAATATTKQSLQEYFIALGYPVLNGALAVISTSEWVNAHHETVNSDSLKREIEELPQDFESSRQEIYLKRERREELTAAEQDTLKHINAYLSLPSIFTRISFEELAYAILKKQIQGEVLTIMHQKIVQSPEEPYGMINSLFILTSDPVKVTSFLDESSPKKTKLVFFDFFTKDILKKTEARKNIIKKIIDIDYLKKAATLLSRWCIEFMQCLRTSKYYSHRNTDSNILHKTPIYIPIKPAIENRVDRVILKHDYTSFAQDMPRKDIACEAFNLLASLLDKNEKAIYYQDIETITDQTTLKRIYDNLHRYVCDSEDKVNLIFKVAHHLCINIIDDSQHFYDKLAWTLNGTIDEPRVKKEIMLTIQEVLKQKSATASSLAKKLVNILLKKELYTTDDKMTLSIFFDDIVQNHYQDTTPDLCEILSRYVSVYFFESYILRLLDKQKHYMLILNIYRPNIKQIIYYYNYGNPLLKTIVALANGLIIRDGLQDLSIELLKLIINDYGNDLWALDKETITAILDCITTMLNNDLYGKLELLDGIKRVLNCRLLQLDVPTQNRVQELQEKITTIAPLYPLWKKLKFLTPPLKRLKLKLSELHEKLATLKKKLLELATH